MTIIMDIEIKCAVCGETSSQPMLGSTNTMGYPDLDLRPAEMQRSTMNTWVLECPHCGYASDKLDRETSITQEFLKTDSYISCNGFDFKSNLSKIFYRAYLIAKKTGDIENEFLNIKCCAWACDDVQDPLSVEMRKLAVESINELIKIDLENRDTLLVLKSDLLRRSRQYDSLIREFENIHFADELLNRIIAFQIQKAKAGDDGCYTIEDVVK